MTPWAMASEWTRCDIFARCLCVAVATVSIQAQDPDPPARGRMEGVLVNEVTGAPVPKGSIRLQELREGKQTQAPATHSAASGAEGNFVIEGIRPGRYRLTAERQGYASRTHRATGSTALVIQPGQDLKDIRIAMTPFGVIAGRVVDEENEPMTLVRVSALRAGYLNGRRRFAATTTPTTVDDRGSFRIANLPPGRYVIEATRVRGLEKPNASESEYITTYHPSAPSFAGAAVLWLTPGGELDATVRMRRERVYRVAGTVVDAATSAPIEDNSFMLLLRSRESIEGAMAPHCYVRDGTFEFINVSPGEYTIEPSGVSINVGGVGRVEAKHFGSYAVSVEDRDISDIRVPLRAGSRVAGAVRNADAPSAAGGEQAPSGANLPSQIWLRTQGSRGRDFMGLVRKDGTFEMTFVAPDIYRIAASGLPEGAYLKKVRFRERDYPDEFLDLTAGTDESLGIYFSSRGGTITGTVRDGDGQGLADVLITLNPKRHSRSMSLALHQSRSGPDGSFRATGLTPGEYQLLSWEDADPDLIMNSAFYAQFEHKAAKVTVSEGSEQTVDPVLIPSIAIREAETKLP